MKGKAKPVFLFFLTVFSLQRSVSLAQTNIPDYLTQKFQAYVKAVPREEIFVQFDRGKYMAGEEVWFNLMLMDRHSLQPSDHSRVAYLEVLNSQNKPVVQKKVLLENGYGPGQFTLPDTLGTGTYTLRAYTSWMKNFLPYNCFLSEFQVFNISNIRNFREPSHTGNILPEGTVSFLAKEISHQGISMDIINSRPDSVVLLIKAGDTYRFDNRNTVYAFIQTRGNINRVTAEKLTNPVTRIAIAKSSLGEGIHQITLFDAKGRPVSERYAYTPRGQNHKMTVNAVDSCGLRSRIIFNLDITPEITKSPRAANLSVSVTPVNGGPGFRDLEDFLIFGTEFGRSTLSGTPDEKISKLPPAALDSLLTRMHSNWIDWEKILSVEDQSFIYPAEKEFQSLTGKLFVRDQQPADSGKILLLCIPGKQARFQYARTDGKGNFTFHLPVDAWQKDVIIMEDEPDPNHKITFESSFSDRYFTAHNISGNQSLTSATDVTRLSVNYQVSTLYNRDKTPVSLPPAGPALSPLRFYGKPDIELKMADYIKLPVMEEVFFELLPHVSLKKKNSVYEIVITDRVDNNLYVTSPCLMIDGVVIKDPSLIIGLDPEIIEKIDVIKENYRVGKYQFPGIINVITKTADFSCVTLPGYMVRMPYRAIDPSTSFVSTDYTSEESKSSRIPDYRNTLFWNPSLQIGPGGKARVEFWTSDNKGEYEVDLQGLLPDGSPVSIRKTIVVR